MAVKKSRKKAKSAKAKKATKDSLNKTAAVQGYLNTHPDAKPKQISTDLAEQGVEVTPNYASMIKSKYKHKPGSGKASRGRPDKQVSGAFAVNDLYEAKKFVDQLGGVDRAKEVLGVIAKLQ